MTEGASLETQEKFLRGFAEQNGFEIVEVFVERGESAKTAERPALKAMMTFCKRRAKTLDAVIVHKLDRLARNTDDYAVLRMFFVRLGIRIVSATENVDNTPVGRFLENTLASIAEFDNEIRAERCRSGMVEAVKQGRFVWPAPLGYRNVKQNGKANIAPHGSSSPLVLRTFELLATGLYRPEEIRHLMEKEGLRNRKGEPLSRTRFHVLIRNPVYMGVIEAFGMRCQGTFTPIVPPDLFYKVQEVLDGQRRDIPNRYKKNHPDFPLRGFLICGECGAKYTGSWSTGRSGKYAHYCCRVCRGPGTNKDRDEMHAAFKALLHSYEYSPDLLELLKAALAANLELRRAGAVRRRREIARELEQRKADRKALVLKDLRGEYADRTLVQELLADFDWRLAELASEQAQLAEPQDAQPVLDFAFDFLASLGDRWDSADLEIKQRFQKFLFPQGISYHRDGKFGTIPSLLLIQLKKDLSREKSCLVDQTGNFWNRLAAELAQLHTALQPGSA